MFLRLFEGWGSSYIVNHCYMPQKSRKPFLTEFQSLEPWCWLRQPFCRCIRRCRRTSLVYLVHLLSLVQAQLQNSWIPETYTNQNHVLNMIFDMFYSSVCLFLCASNLPNLRRWSCVQLEHSCWTQKAATHPATISSECEFQFAVDMSHEIHPGNWYTLNNQFLGKDLAKSRQQISFNEPRDFDETPRGLRDWAAVVNVWKQNIKN